MIINTKQLFSDDMVDIFTKYTVVASPFFYPTRHCSNILLTYICKFRSIAKAHPHSTVKTRTLILCTIEHFFQGVGVGLPTRKDN